MQLGVLHLLPTARLNKSSVALKLLPDQTRLGFQHTGIVSLLLGSVLHLGLVIRLLSLELKTLALKGQLLLLHLNAGHFGLGFKHVRIRRLVLLLLLLLLHVLLDFFRVADELIARKLHVGQQSFGCFVQFHNLLKLGILRALGNQLFEIDDLHVLPQEAGRGTHVHFVAALDRLVLVVLHVPVVHPLNDLGRYVVVPLLGLFVQHGRRSLGNKGQPCSARGELWRIHTPSQ